VYKIRIVWSFTRQIAAALNIIRLVLVFNLISEVYSLSYVLFRHNYIIPFFVLADPMAAKDDLQLISSKDAILVLRLSATLHVRTSVMDQVLEKVESPTVPRMVPATAVKSAKRLYHAMQQQKSIFLQVNMTTFVFIINLLVTSPHTYCDQLHVQTIVQSQ
jgi:hypothetical protein